jgi:hypothetical protein
MTKVPSTLRAPAEIQSVHASTPTSHSNSRCKDCGAPLDVWNSCPNIPASEARLRSSVQGPAYCGRRPPSGRLWNFAVDMLGVGRVLGCGQILRGATSHSRAARRKSERDSFAPAHSSTAGFYRRRREARSAFLRTTLCGSRPGCAEYHARNQDSHLP